MRNVVFVLVLTFSLVSLFVGGFTVGRASTAGRTVVQNLDPRETREVLAKVDDVSRAFVAVSASARPAVVHIVTTRLVAVEDPFADFFEFMQRRRRTQRYSRQQSIGSGTIVDSRGLILTNAHVVRQAVEIDVYLSDGRRLKAQPLGLEEETDLALIKIEGQNLPVLSMGDSDKIEVGQWVIAIGNPFGLDQTVTGGIISAKGRVGVSDNLVEDFIQTDAAINPGNSGGPLIDLKGNMIGVNTMIYSKTGGYQGIGFAIPINFARSRMAAILESRRK